MLSSASEKIAAEPVRKYAMNLIVSSEIPTTSDKLAATASLLGTRRSQSIMAYSNVALFPHASPLPHSLLLLLIFLLILFLILILIVIVILIRLGTPAFSRPLRK